MRGFSKRAPHGNRGRLCLDPGRLTGAADILDAAAGSLDDSAPRLRPRPDAGVSTDEVARALTALAGAVAAVTDALRGTADGARTSAADYTATDEAVHGSMGRRGRSLVE